MDTIQMLQKIILETIKASSPCDIRYATISSLSPLTIVLESVQLSVQAPSVLQLESTLELTMDNIEHTHRYYDSDTDGESQDRDTEKALENIQCYLGGQALGRTQDNKIIIRKGLAVNDKVAVIKVGGGQQYLILGRV